MMPQTTSLFAAPLTARDRRLFDRLLLGADPQITMPKPELRPMRQGW
jgi:hypothetical protein